MLFIRLQGRLVKLQPAFVFRGCQCHGSEDYSSRSTRHRSVVEAEGATPSGGERRSSIQWSLVQALYDASPQMSYALRGSSR
eukprot:3447121-Amphidinium_carterae.1